MGHSNLFDKLPSIWHRFDVDGVLERFLGVLDTEFDRVEDIFTSILDTRSVEKIDSYYLYLLSHIVGHTWRDELTRDWNRGWIRNAVTIHSYKGTLARFNDLVIRNGGAYWKHVDMASQIIVPGSQGYLGGQSSYLMGPIYYHPGAHKFYVDEEVRDTDFEQDVQLIRPAGEVWFITYVASISTVFAFSGTLNAPEVVGHQIGYSSGLMRSGYLGSSCLGSFFFEPFDSMCLMDHSVL